VFDDRAALDRQEALSEVAVAMAAFEGARAPPSGWAPRPCELCDRRSGRAARIPDLSWRVPDGLRSPLHG